MTKVAKKSKPKKKGKLAECQTQLEEYKAGWQRAKADYANLQKRMAASSSETVKYANTDLILQILPILDNFQSAYQALPAELEKDNWAQGIGFIRQQMEKLLEDNKVVAIKAVGEKFDPNYHEAVEEIESEEKKGVVCEEVLRGYMLEDKVIRAAKVKVAK